MSNDNEKPVVIASLGQGPRQVQHIPVGFERLKAPQYDAINDKLTSIERRTDSQRFGQKMSDYQEVAHHIGPTGPWYWRVAESKMGIRIIDLVLQRLVEHITSDNPIVQSPRFTAYDPWDVE